MKKAYMTYGRPGAGKSTWCRNHPDFTGDNISNMDTIREKFPHARPHEIWAKGVEEITQLAAKHNTVFVDNTHVRKHFWDMFSKPLRDAGFTIILVYFDINVNTCLKQNLERDRIVPAKVIEKWSMHSFHALPYSCDDYIIVT